MTDDEIPDSLTERAIDNARYLMGLALEDSPLTGKLVHFTPSPVEAYQLIAVLAKEIVNHIAEAPEGEPVGLREWRDQIAVANPLNLDGDARARVNAARILGFARASDAVAVRAIALAAVHDAGYPESARRLARAMLSVLVNPIDPRGASRG